LNEQDFRTALRDTMSGQVEPPQMSDSPVLEAAHRDLRRRRAKWAGLGSAAAVVAVAVGVAVLAPPGSGDGGVRAGSQPSVPASGRGANNTEKSWPNGQTDRTATSGAQHERAATLADKLAEVAPAGYDLPDSLPGTEFPAKEYQAQYEDTIGGREVWDYMAYVSPTKGTGVGELLVDVRSPGGVTGDGCGINPPVWGMTGDCAEVAVGDKRVAVVNITTDNRFNQWAGYRYEDGTVVFVAQSLSHYGTGQPALDALPFTPEQLAALAGDPRFKVV
jgi:hypothetical protein